VVFVFLPVRTLGRFFRCLAFWPPAPRTNRPFGSFIFPYLGLCFVFLGDKKLARPEGNFPAWFFSFCLSRVASPTIIFPSPAFFFSLVFLYHSVVMPLQSIPRPAPLAGLALMTGIQGLRSWCRSPPPPPSPRDFCLWAPRTGASHSRSVPFLPKAQPSFGAENGGSWTPADGGTILRPRHDWRGLHQCWRAARSENFC